VFTLSDFSQDTTIIHQSQVLIPSPTTPHAYLPFEKDESEETKAFFPHDKTNLPLIFSRNPDKPYNLHYLETRVFRSTPRIDKVEDYIAWLNRV